MDDALKSNILSQLNHIIMSGTQCTLCTNQAKLACLPGPKDQLRLMQALPEEQKGQVHGIGFPLCSDCVNESASPDDLINEMVRWMKKEQPTKQREVKMAQVIPFRRRGDMDV